MMLPHSPFSTIQRLYILVTLGHVSANDNWQRALSLDSKSLVSSLPVVGVTR